MDNSAKPPAPEPYIPVKAGDILLAESWHNTQIAARQELWERIVGHGHRGAADGVRLDAAALSDQTMLSAGTLGVASDSALGSQLTAAADVEVGQEAALAGLVVARSTLDVAGKLSARKGLRVGTGSSFTGKLTVTGATTVRGNMTVRGRVIPSSLDRGAFAAPALNLNLDTVDLSTVQAVQLTLTYGDATGFDPVIIDIQIPYWEFDISTSFTYTTSAGGSKVENVQIVPKYSKIALVSWIAVPINGSIHLDNTSINILMQGAQRWPWTGQDAKWETICDALKSWDAHRFLIHLSRQVPVFKVTQTAKQLQLILPVPDAKAVIRTRASGAVTVSAQFLPFKPQLGALNQQLKLDEATAALYSGDFSLAKTRWS